MIRVRLLGPIDVAIDGAPAPPELLWRKHIALLVYLARSPDRSRSRDHLLTLLWDDKSDDAARHSLNEAIRIMRRCTGGSVDRQQQRVQLSEESVQLDVDEFEQLLSRNDVAGATQLVGGEFMEGFAVPDAWEFEEWLSQERRYWRERCVRALVRHAQEGLACGDATGALRIANRALQLDRTSDEAARARLNASALLGDRAGALRFYDEFVAHLDEQLGIEPGPQTEALVERIRGERVWSHAADGSLPVTARRAPLVAVQRELAALTAAWIECTREKRCALVVIEGDTGTGKTRLLEELAIRARLEGALVISVRALAADRERAWSTASALLQALPGASTTTDPAETLTRELSAIVRQRPVLVCVDDAHYIDRETASLLASLLRSLARQPALLALSSLPHAAPAEIEELRARIGRDVAGVGIKTRLLDADALRALARWSLPAYDDMQVERVARRLSADSAGVAFLAVELLHAVVNGLDLTQTNAAWPMPMHTMEQTLPGDLPDTVVAAIRVGFGKLSPPAQSVLAAAAVLPNRVSAPVLVNATGLEGDKVEQALDELEWQRWLAADPRGYSFVARIARDVVAEDMVTEGQRQRILAAAGSAAAASTDA